MACCSSIRATLHPLGNLALAPVCRVVESAVLPLYTAENHEIRQGIEHGASVWAGLYTGPRLPC
jgi:hypothetical protein